jgi:hypothetical protein
MQIFLSAFKEFYFKKILYFDCVKCNLTFIKLDLEEKFLKWVLKILIFHNEETINDSSILLRKYKYLSFRIYNFEKSEHCVKYEDP